MEMLPRKVANAVKQAGASLVLKPPLWPIMPTPNRVNEIAAKCSKFLVIESFAKEEDEAFVIYFQHYSTYFTIYYIIYDNIIE